MSLFPNTSRRKRRLLWTGAILIAVALVSVFIAVKYYRAIRPTPYRPGEKLEGITSDLSLGLPEEVPIPQFTDISRAAGIDFVQFSGPRSSQLPEDMGSGAAWGDYDNDGDEDLFLVSNGGALDLPAEQWAPSLLFTNSGDGTFRQDNDFPETRIIGMAAAWADYDDDGWLDLVITGYNSILLYHNNSGKFERDARFSAPDGFWAGVAWGDYDNDRDLDLYVCGYVRYRNDETTLQESTRQYGTEVPYTLNPSSYTPERNLLFQNQSSGTFREMAQELGVDNPKGRSLNAVWHDFNDDGWLDLYVANDVSDNVFYLNKQGTFEDISHAGWVADYRGAMGLATGDWDGDGDDDLFVTHWLAQENALYDSLFADTAPRKPEDGSTDLPRLEQKAPVRFMDMADMTGLGQSSLRNIGWGTGFFDLDADGWLDLLVINGSTLETSDNPPRLRPQSPFIFWNNKGQSFHNLTPLAPHLEEKHVGRGLAVADYDHDGDLDLLVVNHAEGVQLFRNDMQTRNWIAILLRNHRGPDRKATGRGEEPG